MPLPTDYTAFTWIGQVAQKLDVYASFFSDAAVEIMGETPYLNSRAAGISFALTKDSKVKSVFLYANGIEGFAQYTGPLPAGLTFKSSRSDVCAAIGEPSMSADAGGVGLMAIEHAFDRFEDGISYMRFVYAAGDTAILHITFGLSDD